MEPKLHFRAYKNQPLDPVLSQIRVAHILITFSLRYAAVLSFHLYLSLKYSLSVKIYYLCEIYRVFWEILPFSQPDVDRRLRGAYCLHHKGDHNNDDGGSTHL
jgi:hypothetical protein